tara:strand:+ start:2690 stop:2929 length:240 start_codon:yes stop_codon:yes gene_type:complete
MVKCPTKTDAKQIIRTAKEAGDTTGGVAALLQSCEPRKKKAPSPYNKFMAKCSVKPNKDFGKCATEWGKMTDSAKAKYK